MASMKRELPFGDEPQLKKVRVAEPGPPQTVSYDTRVVLNPADCDIDFNVERGGLQGSALYEEGFAYCWSGARANVGITRGKYCFGCKIVSAQLVNMEDTPPDMQHVCRVGISRGDDAVRSLGETLNSFGFGGTGKFSSSGTFSNYGERFGVGDTIICAVDLESRPMASIGFSKNGKWLGVAKHFDAGPSGLGVVDCPNKKLQWESALFPHVLLKNVVVQLQSSIDDGLIPVEGYKPWAAAILDGNAILGPAFLDQSDCEVMMMVGLPASGKTTWAERWMKEHPEKRYVLLGTNLALEQMKVPGLLRKHNYGERFDRLMDRATKIFNVLLSRASKIRRNFIIDQTNVYKNARRRKLKPFLDYIKIAVVVFPRAEELKLRAAKRFREMGKEVPAEAVHEMLANYTLPMSKDMPMTNEYFDQVLFVELSREEAQRSLDEMKRQINAEPCVLNSRENSLMSSGGSKLQKCHNAQFQSFIGPSVQNQGVGDHYQNSSSSQPISGAPYGSYYSSSSTHDSRHGFGYIGSSKGDDYMEWRTNESQNRVLPVRRDINEFNQNYGMDNLGGSTIAAPYPRTSSLSYNTYDDRYANTGGTSCGPSALSNSAHESAAPFSYGNYGAQLSRPPYGSFPNNLQHSGAPYPHPFPLRNPSMNLQTNLQPPYGSSSNYVQQAGAYPQPPPPTSVQPIFPANFQRPGHYSRPPHGF